MTGVYYTVCARCGKRELFIAENFEDAIRDAARAGWRWNICPACAGREGRSEGEASDEAGGI